MLAAGFALSEISLREQIGSPLPRATESLGVPPSGDPAMVPGEQDFWHPPTLKLGGPGVLRLLEQTLGAETLVFGRLRVADDTRNQPHHSLDDRQRRSLSSGEHEVAERDLLVDQVGGHPLIDSFVSPADEGENLESCPAIEGRLYERRTDGRQQHTMGIGKGSSAAASGSIIMTIPAPPPNGASSTWR